ncbi:MAG: acetate--CoA ligase family protein [Spirochaetaceae bacterium]|nr:MAG: acetate--CoA ligase family protein [Spirochaetaceae bacterium]
MRFEREFQAPDLQPLIAPASIAVVGASENPGPGMQVLENLGQLGYRGAVYPVNPRYKQVLGKPCYPSLAAVREAGHTVDLVAILLNRNLVLPVLEEAARIEVRAAWAFANGFAEAGEEGRALQQRITDLCREQDILFCGPNCVGILNFNGQAGAYSAPAPREIVAGDIGMVAQSGYVCIQVANANRGLGFSMILSAGNEAVVDATDYIGYMLEDPGTRVIMAFIEQFRRPERLPALARRARELGKPIVLIKVGRSEMARRATAAHTGALAGSDDVQDALFKQLGLIRVDDFDEMFETAELFSKLGNRLPRGNGVFALTLSGGIISLLGDLGEKLCLRFPGWSAAGSARVREHLPPYAGVENPLDAWGFGKVEEAYLPCLSAAAREPEADLILVSQDVPGGMAPRQVEQYAAVAEAAATVCSRTDKPVVFLSNPSGGFDATIRSILDRAGVPLLQGSKEGLRAIDHAVVYAQFLGGDPPPSAAGPSPAAPKVRSLLDRARGGLTEFASKQVLTAYGIPCTQERLCRSAAEAVAAAREIGMPVTLKVMSPRILHKTEAGVIALDLCDEQEILKSFDRLLEAARTYDPKASIDGVLCQQMVGGAVAEAIVGLLIDPQFGPAVIFGLGGVMVEVLGDRALGIPPLDRNSARRMIEQTRASRVLKGFRASPPADIEALIDVLIGVGTLALDWAERIEALDINPLLIRPEGQGVVAVDALLVLKDSGDETKSP